MLDVGGGMNHLFSMRKICRLGLLLGYGLGVAAFAEEAPEAYGTDRYALILEREPFGQELVIEVPTVTPAQEIKAAQAAAKAAEKELRLCFIFETTAGEIRAGFQNKTAKPGDPKSIMLGVGESFRGMQLLSVDMAESSATLDRDGVRVNFSLAKAPTPAAAKQAVAATPRRFGSGFRAQPQKPEPKPKEPELTPEQQKVRREEIQENLRQYQMEVIRAGMPPLPIPLTKEMDDQLVTEGILPPSN
tara:strand:+ start:2510 stop:3247 length:738 start_codon:yes stop_codon:yes gene_type:complete